METIVEVKIKNRYGDVVYMIEKGSLITILCDAARRAATQSSNTCSPRSARLAFLTASTRADAHDTRHSVDTRHNHVIIQEDD